MSVELTPTLETKTEQEWTPPLPPTDLIFDDGEPLESNRHRIAMNVLIEAIHQAYEGRDDYYTSGNMFVYYSSRQARNQDFRGPDFFVALNVDGIKERQGWVVWEEEGRYPDVIVELMSPSTAHEDIGPKKDIYEQTFRTRDYFVYNPFDRQSLQGWHLDSNGRYQEITADDRGWLWCQSLELWLGVWNGTLTKENAPWLRFFDAQGNLILLSQELAKQERERAEQERERAEQERERAEQERDRANAAEARLRELQDRLQAMGIDPNTVNPSD
ncbi:Uma2 family endonuclease [Roseofilum capinflatum]|uniref:Uma2 family endonuclease n=1 Tax=Roseofilum capinflatum BLCC-M114 TaxID=3022440 RepID=A0ABT7B164_9CYAN|nr:Uma2 family endonuclease [Roseofilum capinflatum]MDJ1172871.1 Uma2 family endonuclease [Roseofilum capinflatum BLCC-M114]